MHVTHSVLFVHLAQLAMQASQVFVKLILKPGKHSVQVSRLAAHKEQFGVVHFPKPTSKKKPGFA